MADQLSRLKREMEDFVNKAVRKLSLEIVANLTAPPSSGGTPVDTGWARSNWIPAIGVPVRDPAGSRSAVTTSAQQAGVASLLSYTRDKGTVFISNNVHYINKLNAGSSSQAPAGFVQVAIIKAIGSLQK